MGLRQISSLDGFEKKFQNAVIEGWRCGSVVGPFMHVPIPATCDSNPPTLYVAAHAFLPWSSPGLSLSQLLFIIIGIRSVDWKLCDSAKIVDSWIRENTI